MNARGSRLAFLPLRITALAALLAGAPGCGDGGQSSSASIELVPAEGQCLVTISMLVGSGVTTLDFTVDHSNVAGSIVADGRAARCVRVLDTGEIVGGLGLDHCDGPAPTADCHRSFTLIMRQDLGHEAEAPTDIARCLFDVDDGTSPQPEQFELEYINAAGPDLTPVVPIPVLAVTGVDCSGMSVSTSSTTSSTLPGCSADPCGDAEVCVEDECVPTSLFEVELSIVEELHLGALQLAVRYDAADGAFVGVGQGVRCVRNPSLNGFATYNHIVEEHPRFDHPMLIAAISSALGFDTPPWFMRCAFEATTDVPTAETFTVEVQDASDADAQPLDATVVVSRIRPIAPD